MPKRKSPPLSLRMPNDTVPFNNANDMLEAMGVHYTRPSKDQLKVGRYNYYPNTGSIVVDGETKARAKRGREALKALLLQDRAKLDRYVVKRKAEAARRKTEEAERAREAGEDDASPKTLGS